MALNLETATGERTENPSVEQIANQLAALPGGTDSFAILARDELTYVQTVGGPAEGFVLEYQDGSVEQHYRAIDSNLPLETVTKVFQLYAADDPSWRSTVAWELDVLDTASGGLPLVVALIVAGAIGVIGLWWWLAG